MIKNNPIIIKLENISKAHNNIDIFTGINLEINQGEIIGICGDSGSGKTTLLQIIGLLECASNGALFIENENQLKKTDKEKNIMRRKNIGFIYQFHHLCKEFTVIENIMLPLLINKIPKKTATEQAMYDLELVNMKEKSSFFPDQLSGGEKQRAAIIRAIIHNPKIIIADEPTGSLDPKLSTQIFNIFLKLARQKNITVLIATHNYDLANKCDKIFHMKEKCFLEKNRIS